MTDLQINIALAQACGWLPSGKYAIMYGQYQVFRKILSCNKDGALRKFDYRDPVVFTAICKRWRLDVRFSGVVFVPYICKTYRFESIEKAAAMCVIELAKRGRHE